MNLTRLLKYREYRNYDEFSKFKSISRIEDKFYFALVNYLFSSVSLQIQRKKRKIIIPYCGENFH